MRSMIAMLLVSFALPHARAGTILPGGVQLLCHRTANEDIPENTLESLDQAALLGCNVVEIDLRRTLDGKIVLNHDGVLERLTDGIGEVETSYYGDLQLRDAGSWMADRFAHLHMALFEDAVRLARERDIRLVLDLKDKGLAADVLQILAREGMLQRVQFGGEWDDVKKLYPAAINVGDKTVWAQPGVSRDQVSEYHRQGKAVVANFSANDHEMDLAAMKAAVAAGVDGINVDYPRLGADAVGRPVERKVGELIQKADSGDSEARTKAIFELSRYSGIPLQANFARWLLDIDGHVSRAAALALVNAHPQPPVSLFSGALQSDHADARANAAWALGMLAAPADTLLPLLQDKDPRILQSALLALGRDSGDVSAMTLLPLLSNEDSGVRGAAAIALARHQPDAAIKAIPEQLQKEVARAQVLREEHVRRGQSDFTQGEIDAIMQSFKCQMEMLRAIVLVGGKDSARVLARQAFRSQEAFSSYNGIIAGFQLWDRIGPDASFAVEALSSNDQQVADRAEWVLVKAGPAVLPQVRSALTSENQQVQRRAIRIVAWQGDSGALETLRKICQTNTDATSLAEWAIEKIESLHPKM